jgi:uncharacterized RDD family membrane protein YckC
VARIDLGLGRLVEGAGDALEPVAEKSIDRMLAGTLPESVAQSIVRNHVLERVVSEIVASPEFRAAFTAALQDERTGELVDEVARSPLLERVIRDAVSSPAVRQALTASTSTVGSEMVGSLRRATVRADAAVERPPRRWLHRPVPAAGVYAGAASRGLALVLDVLIAQLLFLVVAGSVALVTSLTVGGGHSWWYGALAGVGWLIVQAAYFIGFWASAGRTPGMALLGLRVRDARNQAPGVIRSAVRLVGLWIAVAIVFLGFVPVLVDDRRRALQDFLAGTEVVYSSGEGEVASPAPEEG